MTIKVAINGFGRIGRCILRAFYESQEQHDLRIVAVNDLGPVDTLVHLTEFDTTHGRFNATVGYQDGHLLINEDRIKLCAEADPKALPWAELGVDVVLECTGRHRSRELAAQHISAGAKKCIISAPAQGDIDATVVMGVNDDILTAAHTVISNASCTTNCLSPLVKPLHQAIGVESGLMTSIHAYTNDQLLIDNYHADLRRARSATMSQIPTKTGAAAAIGLVLPELDGKLDGYAMRVPTLNVSAVDLTFVASRKTSVQEVNEVVQCAAAQSKVLHYSDRPLVSVDYNHSPYSSNFDATITRVMPGNLVKVLSWYDNEWGFANRMLDITEVLMNAK